MWLLLLYCVFLCVCFSALESYRLRVTATCTNLRLLLHIYAKLLRFLINGIVKLAKI